MIDWLGLGKSLTGNITKAMICVPDKSKLEQAKNRETPRESMDRLKRKMGRTAANEVRENGYLSMGVKYNPSRLRLQSQADKPVNYVGGKMGNASINQMTQQTQPASTTLYVQLVFDDAKSIQNQVEGLLSLLTLDVTRQVFFCWSQMCFQGDLTEVNVQYKMFNESGDPIRGVVDLTIRQTDSFHFNQFYWNDAFDKAFGKEKEWKI